MAEIKDSGSRREFESGAVRDIQEGKGRCDLLPLDVVAEMHCEPADCVFKHIDDFIKTRNVHCLIRAIDAADLWDDQCTMLLEVAKHFEAGAVKYGERNWEKGIPLHCYIDSGIRHYLKWCRGDEDEPHDRAFAWNMLCAMWTCKHHPELDDLPKAEEEELIG